MKKQHSVITPILTLDDEEVIIAINAAARLRLPYLRIGEHLRQYRLNYGIADPAHYSCYIKNQQCFFSYRPAADFGYQIFPGLLQNHFGLQTGTFLPILFEKDHEQMMSQLASFHEESGRISSQSRRIFGLDDMLSALCGILTADMLQSESVDVFALFKLLRKRMIAAFEKFGCSICIDTVELLRDEIYPIYPVVWLALLIQSEMMLLYASDTCRLELFLTEEDGVLIAEITSDGSLKYLETIAPVDLAFNRIIAKQSGMELTLSGDEKASRIRLTQPLRLDAELVLHAPIALEEMRREALLSEFDKKLSI